MPKRARHYPGITPRGNSILIDFSWEGKRCRETLKLAPSAPNMAYADTLRRSIIDAITLGKFTAEDYEKHFPNSKWLKRISHQTGHKRTVNKCLDTWLGSVQHTMKYSTIKTYRSMICILQREFDDKLLVSDLSIIHIKDLITRFQANNITVKTIRNRLSPLREMLDNEVEMETIPSSPLDKLKKIPKTEQEKIRAIHQNSIDPFDIEEVNAIISAADSNPQLQKFIKYNFATGLRMGEMFGLAYEDMDFIKGTIHICRSRTCKRLGTPKTKESIRTLELLPGALAAIKAQKEYTFMKPAIDCGPFGKLHFVFYNPHQDAPWADSQDFRKVFWAPLLRKAGIRYRYPYQMRHTFASLCLAAGEDLGWVAKQLGHVNTLMVIRNYSKWLPNAAAAAGRSGGEKIKVLLK